MARAIGKNGGVTAEKNRHIVTEQLSKPHVFVSGVGSALRRRLGTTASALMLLPPSDRDIVED